MRPLQVFVFNVGQGDNLLLRFPDGSFGFIDLCYDGRINTHEVPPSLTYVQHNVEESNPSIAFFHLSHYHADHIKGFDNWVEWATKQASLQRIWLPGSMPPQTILSHFLRVLQDEEAVCKFLEKNPEMTETFNKIHLQYGRGYFSKLEVFFQQHQDKTDFLNSERRLSNVSHHPVEVIACCLGPSSATCTKFTEMTHEEMLRKLLTPKNKAKIDGNDISAILQIGMESHRLFFGGDASIGHIEACLKTIQETPEIYGNAASIISNFFKVAHHGSNESSNLEMWKQVLPVKATAYLAISAGEGHYGHPHKETFKHIEVAANEKETQARIVATNAHSLTVPDMQKCLYECAEILPVKWPKPQQSTRQKNKEEVFDQCVDPMNIITRKQHYSDEMMSLGYCFEFDINGDHENRVYKIMPNYQ